MSKEFVKERVLKYLMEDLLVPQDMIDTNEPLSEFEEGAEGVLDIIVNVVVKEHGEDYYVPVLIVTCVDEDFVMEGEALQKEIDLKQKELKILEEKVLFWEEDKDKTINEIYEIKDKKYDIEKEEVKIKENLNLDKKLSLDLKDKVNNLQKKYDNLNKEYLYLKSKIKINDLSIKVKEIAENEKKVEKLNDEVSILNKEKAINNGALFENVVAQELLAKRHKEYYFNSKQQGELDFVIELDGKVVPLEIKSGKDYKRHSALNNVLKNENYKIEEAYILSEGNIEIEGKRVYMPIYMIMFLENTELTNTIYKIDLDGLGE